MQGFLDHLRVDVVTAADDQVLAAPGQPDVAVSIDATEVAGIEPVAIDPDAGVLARLQIALEYRGTADAQVADLILRCIPEIASLLVEYLDAHFAVRHGQADGAGAAFARWRVGATAAGAFGQAIAFEQGQAGLGLELAYQLHRHGGGAAQGVFQRGQVMTLAGNLQQAGIDGGNTAEEADLVARDHLPEIADQCGVAIALRRGQQHFCAADESRQPGDDHAVDVEQRQATERHVADTEAGHQIHAVGHRHFVAVAVRRQLGRTGGAAGVEVAGDVVGGDHATAFQVVGGAGGDGFIEIQHALRQQAALGLERAALWFGQQVGHVHAENRFQLRQLIAQGIDFVPQLGAWEGRQGHQQLGVGRVDQLGDVLGIE